MRQVVLIILLIPLLVGCGTFQMNRWTMEAVNMSGAWSLVGMFVNQCDTKEAPMISFENLVIHQSGKNLKLDFMELAMGVPVLEGDGGYHFDGQGKIDGNTISWESKFFDASDNEVLINFNGNISQDGKTFMGNGRWTRKDEEVPCHGSLTFAGELIEE